jgi:hypothetical protein
MSELNVEIVKRALDAFNDSNVLVGPGDPLPWLREFCDAGIELDLSRQGADARLTQDQQARSVAWRGRRQTRVRGGSSPISLR